MNFIQTAACVCVFALVQETWILRPLGRRSYTKEKETLSFYTWAKRDNGKIYLTANYGLKNLKKKNVSGITKDRKTAKNYVNAKGRICSV